MAADRRNAPAKPSSVIAAARRKGVPPAQWDDVEVRRLISTGIDGSGAIGVLAHCRNKRKNVLGLVLKHGVGVRDAWAQEGTQKETDRAFLDAAVADQFTIAPEFLPTMIGHFLFEESRPRSEKPKKSAVSLVWRLTKSSSGSRGPRRRRAP